MKSVPPRLRVLALLSLSLSACAPGIIQNTMSPRLLANEEREQSKRLLRVSASVEMGSAELCGDRIGPLLGILFPDDHSFPADRRTVRDRALPAREHLTVEYVVPGLPAATGGLRPKDKILKAEITGASRHGPVHLEVLRGGERLTLTLNPKLACSYSVFLVRDYGLNALADGEAIGVTTGMLRFIKNDDELALVIGHELAHNVLGHPDYASRQIAGPVLHGMMVGALLESTFLTPGTGAVRALTALGATPARLTFARDFAGRLASFQELEREANNLGLYFTRRAGYDVSRAVDLWRRLGMKFLCRVPGRYQ